MGPLLLVLFVLVSAVTAEQTSHVSFSQGGHQAFKFNTRHGSGHSTFGSRTHVSRPPVYTPRHHSPTKGHPEPTHPSQTEELISYEAVETYVTTSPTYTTPNTPAYSPVHPTTAGYPVTRRITPYNAKYTPRPKAYGKPKPHKHSTYEELPQCSYNTTKNWCLEDYEYPMYEIQDEAHKHAEKLLTLYADVTDLGTHNSVEGLDSLKEETYLCESETSYVRPLRAVNVDGKWRVIVNNIKLNYQVLSQTTRLEECLGHDEPCPLLPSCYESKCTQKSVYHRFLVYDPYDLYFPFVIESFKLPSSCACFLEQFHLD